jgi:hypothetical protein
LSVLRSFGITVLISSIVSIVTSALIYTSEIAVVFFLVKSTID